MEVSDQLDAMTGFPPGKEPSVPIEYEAGWSPELSGRCGVKQKSLASTLNLTAAVWPIGRHYTD
jgi:hypothetical protein